MKKLTSLLLCLILLYSFIPTVQANGDIPVYFNGTRIEKYGTIISDRTYLPVRALCEKIGISVDWIDETKSVILGTSPLSTKKSDTINIYLNGKRLETGEAVIIDGSTYLPVRALCEALNMNVIWDDEKREVHVAEMLTLEYPINEMVQSEGFNLLENSEKERFISYTTNTLYIGQIMRRKITESYIDNYMTLSANEQKEVLLQLLSETVYYRTSFRGKILPEGEKAGYEILTKTFNSSYNVWRGTKKPVTIYHIKMDSGYNGIYHEWNMISSSDSSDASSVITATIEAMSHYPYAVRKFVKTVIYDPDSSNICYGGGNSIWMRISWVPTESEAATTILSCVIGYVLDANVTTDKALWDEAIKKDIVPVSGFGNTNRVSDLGEFNSLYHIAKNMENGLEELERIYPHRFALYASMLYTADNTYYSEYKHYYDKIISAQ